MALSIQDRINALNIGHVRSGPPPPKPSSNKPALPPRLPPRSASTQDIHLELESAQHASIGNLPATDHGLPKAPHRPESSRLPLPPPRQSAYPPKPPALPARNSSGTSLALVRRDSAESVSSTISAHSSISTPSTRTSLTGASTRSTSIDNGSSAGGKNLRVPLYDPSALPPLPPKRNTTTSARPELPSRNSTSRTIPPRPATALLRQESSGPNTTPPPAPPRRHPAPSAQSQARPESSAAEPSGPAEMPSRQLAQPTMPVRAPQPAPARRSALSYGMNHATEQAPMIPQRPTSQILSQGTGTPPPIPSSSRPDLAALQASKPKPGAAPTSTFNTISPSAPPPGNICWKCRDFSGPDNHAARFPRQSLPSQDLQWLGVQLTAPFASHTDKARALFTWCHHNIAYDVVAFFGNNVKPSTPKSTFATGLAVCEGYAAMFTTLALAAGLEAVLISGHGMGFAKDPIQPHEPTPPEDVSGHAWNVVKIDGGEWKLIDVCWGAGSVSNNPVSYKKHLTTEHFTMSNNEFGKKHFPKDPAHQFRTDGRVMSWDEYIRGGYEPKFEKLVVYSGCFETHGLDRDSFVPAAKYIKVRGAAPNQRIQFQFKKFCEHWDLVNRTGRPYPLVLSINGRDGRKKDMVTVRCDPQYNHWWCDVATLDLGCAGQTVTLYAVNTIAGKDARGMTTKEYETLKAQGRPHSFNGIAMWQLT